MKKKLSLLIGLILLLLIASFIFFLKSNLFKDYLTDSILQKTGRKIEIRDALSWSFFPTLQLTAGHVTVSDAKMIWLIDKATVQINPLAFFQKKIAFDEISLENIKININNTWGLAGHGFIRLQCTTKNTEIMQNLNGQGQFRFDQVELQGIDIPYFISVAQHFLNHHIKPAPNQHQTFFKQLTGSFVITQGVITNHDLIASQDFFTTQGAGTVDLKQHMIQYRLVTFINKKTPDEKNDINNLYGAKLPIIINGLFSDIKVNLDTAVLIKTLMDQPILKIKGKKVKPKEAIKHLLGF